MSQIPTPAPAAGQTAFSVGRVMRLARKELRETLRDRRTIITLVLMPLLVYPILSLAFPQFLLSSLQQSTNVPLLIAAQSQEDIQALI